MLLHLLILWLFTTNFNEVKYPPKQVKNKKISLNISQVKTPPPAPKPRVRPKPKVLPQPVTPPTPLVEKKVEPKPTAKVVKRVLLDESKKIFAVKSVEENNVTKVKPKPKKKKIVKKVIKKKTKVKKKKKIVKQKKRKVQKRKPQRRSNDALANMLMGAGTSMNPTVPRRTSGSGNYGEKMIKKLYGSEFNTYTPTQKNYILDNLNTIHEITQRTLTRNGYPDIAVRTRQSGTNIVSFYLHPNGDITGLKLKHRIGYSTLDDNTLKVIRLAYKDYPLPNQKTRLIFNVTYRLY